MNLKTCPSVFVIFVQMMIIYMHDYARHVLHKYANEDVSLGSWFIGLDLEHIDDRRLCCGTPPGKFLNAPKYFRIIIVLDWKKEVGCLWQFTLPTCFDYFAYKRMMQNLTQTIITVGKNTGSHVIDKLACINSKTWWNILNTKKLKWLNDCVYTMLSFYFFFF